MIPNEQVERTIKDAILAGDFLSSTRTAISLAIKEPHQAKAYTYLAIIEQKQAYNTKATRNFKKAYFSRLDDDGVTGRNLWKSYFESGRVSDALNHLSELEINEESKVNLFRSCISKAIEQKTPEQLINNKYFKNEKENLPEEFIATLASICFKEKLDQLAYMLLVEIKSRKGDQYFFASQLEAELISQNRHVSDNPTQAIKRSIIINPLQPNLVQALAQQYAHKSELHKELRWGIIGFLTDPGNSNHAIKIGKKCLDNGVWRFGIPILTLLHTKFPEDGSVFEGLVKLYEKGIPSREALKTEAISLAIGLLEQNKGEHPHIDDHALTLLRLSEQFSDTWKYWDRVIKKHPSMHVLHHNCGFFYSEAKDFEKALYNAKRSAVLKPDYPRVWNLIGLSAGQLHNYEDGIKYCERSIIQVKRDSYYMNQGMFYRSLGDFHNSTRAFRKGKELNQKHVMELRYSIGINQLMIGELGEGFNNYEARWGVPSFTSPKRLFTQKIWKGPEKTPDVDLLVWLEQGMGDEIMFSPYVNELKKDVSRLVVECDHRLVDVFSRSYDGVEFIPRIMSEEQLSVVKTLEYKIPIGHVPQYYVGLVKEKLYRLYRNEIGPGTPQPSVLKFDSNKLQKWKQRLNEVFGSKLVCGVSWASRFTNYTREKQYIGLEDLAKALGGGKDLGVINLQYSYDPDEADRLKELGRSNGFQFYTPDDIDLKDDLDDVLTILRLCDMSVTPLISLAWMTGAVGTPSYIFRSAPEERIWQQLGSPVLPWYPSMKLFFRHPAEDWARVSNEIADQMHVHCGSVDTPRRQCYPEDC